MSIWLQASSAKVEADLIMRFMNEAPGEDMFPVRASTFARFVLSTSTPRRIILIHKVWITQASPRRRSTSNRSNQGPTTQQMQARVSAQAQITPLSANRIVTRSLRPSEVRYIFSRRRELKLLERARRLHPAIATVLVSLPTKQIMQIPIATMLSEVVRAIHLESTEWIRIVCTRKWVTFPM